MTYTYAVLEVSRASFEDIKARLVAAGHSDAIDPDDPLLPDGVLDMHGIALRAEESIFLRAAKASQQPQRRTRRQPQPRIHGVTCRKKHHLGGGYLHDAKDDGPYDVDGLSYCGRCHEALVTT